MREFNKAGHWDSAAERYEKTAHPYTARYVEAALAHVPLTPASRVLDVAAGTGALALAAARTGAQVLATDFSPGMVARIAAKAVPNVEARVEPPRVCRRRWVVSHAAISMLSAAA